jgi:hypothetical protein
LSVKAPGATPQSTPQDGTSFRPARHGVAAGSATDCRGAPNGTCAAPGRDGLANGAAEPDAPGPAEAPGAAVGHPGISGTPGSADGRVPVSGGSGRPGKVTVGSVPGPYGRPS